MDLRQLADVGEFVGGLAVLVTLVYLALQIRQNTRALETSSRQAMVGQMDQFVTMMMEQPHLMPVFRVACGDSPVKATRNPNGLSLEDQHVLNFLMFKAFVYTQSQWESWKNGVLSDDHWKGTTAPLIEFWTQAPAALDWWQHWGRGYFDANFASEVDKVIAARSVDQPVSTTA